VDVSIAIFSYNRGNYVKNCLDSIHQCFPEVPVSIYDDHSTDLTTIRYLESLGCNVVSPELDIDNKHGGLYQNMQIALEAANSRYILFLQDDTQLVRSVDEVDFQGVDAYFNENESAAFVNPVFLKGRRRRSINKQLRPHQSYRGYFHEISEKLKPRPVSMYYCDVVLAHVDRLKSVKWRFQNSETENATQARKHFCKLLQLADPFVMHVPEVPVYRGKKSTFGERLANRLIGSDIKQFQFMTKDEVSEMRQRTISLAPYAEDYLNTVNQNVSKPYHYNCINTHWYTRILHKLEYGVRRLFH